MFQPGLKLNDMQLRCVYVNCFTSYLMKVGVPVYLEMSDGIKVEWNVHVAVVMT